SAGGLLVCPYAALIQNPGSMSEPDHHQGFVSGCHEPPPSEVSIVTLRMTTAFSGRSPSGYSGSLRTGSVKIRRATSRPLLTLPKTVNWLSRNGALLRIKKNRQAALSGSSP